MTAIIIIKLSSSYFEDEATHQNEVSRSRLSKFTTPTRQTDTQTAIMRQKAHRPHSRSVKILRSY